MKNKFQKGFTLIELLVVIAIIGILSSIVLASLSSARTKGEDAAIKATLSSMRSQAELYYSDKGNYGAATAGFEAACPVTAAAETASAMFGIAATSKGLLALSTDLAGKAGTSNHACAATTGGTAWAAAAIMKSDTTQVTCVDSAGVSRTSSSTLAAAITAGAQCN